MGQVIQMAFNGLGAYNRYGTDAAALYGQKVIGQAQIAADNLLAETNANAENVLRGENNTLLAARTALANLQRSEHNEAILKTAGARYGTANTNLLRVLDANTQGDLERRVQAAEQQGAVTADTAARGVGGASARMLKLTLAASAARRETQVHNSQDQQTYDMLAQRAGIMSGAVSSLDEGQTFAPIDVTKSIAKKTLEPLWQRDYMPGKWSAVLGGISGGLGGVAAGLYDKYATGGSTAEASPSGGGNGDGNGFYSTNTSNSVDEYGAPAGDGGGYGEGSGPE